ncbi:MAG: SDR family oxidoreductase [Halioglobus sp.]|nr:SDR family oxidoreductase [Halioglobus sp.]
MSREKSTALVTGASAGLGQEFCRQLATRCDRIIAVARRGERLQALAAELEGSAEVHCVAADLTSVEGQTRVLEALRQKGPVDYLVNNAGFSTFGAFVEQSIDSQRDMLALHLDASISLCRAAIPFMRERGGGVIINVSSLGALLPGKHFSVYGATKAFLNHFSEALQQEVVDSGIQVQALCPGFTRTEFHDVMSGRSFDRERIPPEGWMASADVVAASLAALGSGRVLVVPGEQNLAIARSALEKALAQLG